MGPDRLLRIPSAEKFKKIGQHILLASAILAANARCSDAQSTPKPEPLSNQVVEKQLIIPQQEFEPEDDSFDQDVVNLSDLESNHLEVNLKEIPSTNREENSINNERTKNLLTEDNVSLITGYYCRYVPGYIIGDGGGYCGLTKMGIQVEPGIAACGANYPLGSYIEIEGFGKLLCADRGYLSPNQIDIFFETNEQLDKSNKPDLARVRIVNDP